MINGTINDKNLNKALDNFCGKITYSKIASFTPKMFLNWIFENMKLIKEKFSIEELNITVEKRTTSKIVQTYESSALY